LKVDRFNELVVEVRDVVFLVKSPEPGASVRIFEVLHDYFFCKGFLGEFVTVGSYLNLMEQHFFRQSISKIRKLSCDKNLMRSL
jgi:hypothetical protein